MSKSGVKLDDGEQIVVELEAELYARSANPFAQAAGSLLRLLDRIFGNKNSVFVVVTNKRIIELREHKVCYVFVTQRVVLNVLPQNVLDVGYERKAMIGCCCPAYTIFYNCHSGGRELMVRGLNEDGAAKAAKTFFDAILAMSKKG